MSERLQRILKLPHLQARAHKERSIEELEVLRSFKGIALKVHHTVNTSDGDRGDIGRQEMPL